MKAIVIDRFKYSKANVEFFRSSLAFALVMKQRWRDICMNRKVLDSDKAQVQDDLNFGSGKLDRLPAPEIIRP